MSEFTGAPMGGNGNAEASYSDGFERVKVAPFSVMEVAATVAWDVGEGEEGPDPEMRLELTASELKFCDVVYGVDESEWTLDEDMLEAYVSDVLSDKSGFCHGSFSFDYTMDGRKA